MRQTISGLVAAIALVTASAVPALACGFGGVLRMGLWQPLRADLRPGPGLFGLQQRLRRLGL